MLLTQNWLVSHSDTFSLILCRENYFHFEQFLSFRVAYVMAGYECDSQYLIHWTDLGCIKKAKIARFQDVKGARFMYFYTVITVSINSMLNI